MKIISAKTHPLDIFLNESTVFDRTPGINDNYYLRISASIPGQPLKTLSNDSPAAVQLLELHKEYGCDLEIEAFARKLYENNTQSKTLKLSYP